MYRNPETWNFYLPIHSHGCTSDGWLGRGVEYIRGIVSAYIRAVRRVSGCWRVGRIEGWRYIYMYVCVYMNGGRKRKAERGQNQNVIRNIRQSVCIDGACTRRFTKLGLQEFEKWIQMCEIERNHVSFDTRVSNCGRNCFNFENLVLRILREIIQQAWNSLYTRR